MVSIGTALGKNVSALLTDMSQPLGYTAGNALEVQESLDLLKGAYIPGLSEVTEALCCQALHTAGLEDSNESARTRVQAALANGSALTAFMAMVQHQGGTDDMSTLPKAPECIPFTANTDGVVQQVSAERLGRAINVLGAGRQTLDDEIDHAVGISNCVKIGDEISKGQTLCMLHLRHGEQLYEIEDLMDTAFVIGKNAVEPPILLREEITAASVALSESERIR